MTEGCILWHLILQKQIVLLCRQKLLLRVETTVVQFTSAEAEYVLVQFLCRADIFILRLVLSRKAIFIV